MVAGDEEFFSMLYFLVLMILNLSSSLLCLYLQLHCSRMLPGGFNTIFVPGKASEVYNETLFNRPGGFNTIFVHG